MLQLTSTQPRRVVIAGGGVAAVETLLALRAAPGGHLLEIAVIAPGSELVYRPLAVAEPFGRPLTRRYDLRAICADLGATLVPEALTGVAADRRALGGDGASLPYDALVLATGARSEVALPHAATFGDAESDGVQWIVRELEEGLLRTIAFVVPPGAGWPLPLYELALQMSRRAWAVGASDVRLTLVTPEEGPLAVFRGTGSRAVGRLLAGAGIELISGSYGRDYDGEEVVLTPGDRRLQADRVVALPRLRGPALAGVPCDADGFIRIDEHSRVPGLPGVWAVGDATTSPIKQGGLATQQADAVAAAIARGPGSFRPVDAAPPTLRAMLMTGADPLYLTATLASGGASSASRDCPWWPPHKIAARHLAPYLADRSPLMPAHQH
ncbi:FAD-dependent oxidoreductase [Conexibacter sp. JD483]|uniref:FAD-dependent oxidoreductase n=1 Tax=unclassified Conexibacter TaxID=2627773 RepID=UPI0027287DD2|nr:MULTISPECIES: FAD-dependent oxidoreductase [unclassified Conexibacter]MDO8188347.1 FAD-dependent oxidoreductase [Conexibacter sp. CPCC 205706]MDO8200705.1 FAD-dependent oxidoreductase [Conexibacter sp. CPCC 205762]MDR9369429.1 FAD-dependent oxidoreductase [Conexibacter sp. JD483]